MKKFKILDHTADVRLKIFGQDELDLFSNAFFALNSFLIGDFKQKKIKKEGFEKIEVKGKDFSELLINFLNEVLTLIYINKKIYYKIKFLKFSPIALSAQIFGFKVDKFLNDVKAVAYYNLEIKKTKKGNLETIIVLDI